MIIHVIGDSHTGVFTQKPHDTDIPPFKLHYIAGATAHNLHKKTSSSNSSVRLDTALQEIDKEKDIVLLWFGEIDCRYHIGQAESIDKALDNTVINYAKVLKIIKEEGYNFAVMGIPPCNRDQQQPSDDIKKYIYIGFNNRLEALCMDENYKFIDVFSVSSNIDGFLMPYYARSMNSSLMSPYNQEVGNDFIHLNHRIIPHIIEQINKLFITQIYMEIKGC